MGNLKIYKVKKFISLVLITTTFISCTSSKYSIKKNDNKSDYELYCEEVVDEDEFITIKEAIKSLRVLNADSNISFEDESVSSDDINWAIENGIMVAEENLNLDDNICKIDLATILYYYIGKTNRMVTDGEIYNLNMNSYHDNCISWAIKNDIMNIDDPNSLVTKDEFIKIINSFCKLYKLEYNYQNETILDILKVIDKKRKIPEDMKEPFERIVCILNDYGFEEEKGKEILDTFETIKIKEIKGLSLENKKIGKYYSDDNTITYDSNLTKYLDRYQSTMFHEGLHAISNNKRNKITGFFNQETGEGRGLTEGFTKLLEIEYTNLNDQYGYEYSSLCTAILTQIISPQKLINYYINANVDGLKENIVNILLNGNSLEDSKDKYYGFIKALDGINEYESKYTKENENSATTEMKNDLKINVAKAFKILDELLYLSNGYHIADDALMSAYYEKATSNQYIYYHIEHYFYNKKFIDNPTSVAKLTYKVAHDYAVKNNKNTDKIAASEITTIHPEMLNIIEIDNKEKTK